MQESSHHSTAIKGLRVVVTGYDLEQPEHRGIAVYTKALIRVLSQAGAEVWLLTQFSAGSLNSKYSFLPNNTRQLVSNSRIFHSLSTGQQFRPRWFFARYRLGRFLLLWQERISWLLEMLKRPRTYTRNQLHLIRLSELFDNPYERTTRLAYLQDLEGIISIPGLFLASQLAALLKRSAPVSIDLKGFDVLLTSCPLNLRPINIPVFIQTVHDLIPLEYVAHNEDPVMFAHRLQACLQSRRLFVSSVTSEKYRRYIQNQPDHLSLPPGSRLDQRDQVVIQLPSLDIPEWLSTDPEFVCDLAPITPLLRLPGSLKSNLSTGSRAQRRSNLARTGRRHQRSSNPKLKPFKYVLFNSSVESRKNMLLLAQAYVESSLPSNGILLCVTGLLKNDEYSDAVRKFAEQEPSILLAGYVDENAKLDLFLNAIALLSPSLVEGFGIPVLDSACLGLSAIVSECHSHVEIQSMYDFADYVSTVSPLKSRDWADAMNSIVGLHSELLDVNSATKERQRRIRRYIQYRKTFDDKLRDSLFSLFAPAD